MAVIEVQHALVKHKLGLLRQAGLPVYEFRRLTNELAGILLTEACAEMPLEDAFVDGWQGEPIAVQRLQQTDPTIVPILRAGIGMLDGCLQVLPTATVSVVGLYRDESTLEPVAYFDKVIDYVDQRTAIIIDPMLATGGTLLATIELLKAKGCKDIKGLFLVASPEGVAKLTEAHPDVDCWVAGIDERLNDKGYILPGLGDAGDKIFGTI
ncbi:MAG: uracil phosphoribosyltransferase [Oceanospirillaceae bacterium]|nr:uracil phosphoribosyltransferase [Oceanospirillaceae bacterium]HCI03036.1 uracil phosphoribosyltransferase [Oceanospirillaceae bacterium]